MCHTQHNHCVITHLFATLVSFQSGRAPRGGGSSGANQQPLNISDTILISLIFLQDFSDCVLRWEGSCAATEFGTVWIVGWVGDDFDGIEQTNADTLILCTDSLKVSISNISFSAFWEGVAEVGSSRTSLKSLPPPYGYQHIYTHANPQ